MIYRHRSEHLDIEVLDAGGELRVTFMVMPIARAVNVAITLGEIAQLVGYFEGVMDKLRKNT